MHSLGDRLIFRCNLSDLISSSGHINNHMHDLHLLLFSIVGGYVATWMWSTFKEDATAWISISLGVACFFPGFVFTLHILLNVMYWSNNSTCAMSIWVSILLLLICVGMSVPLTLSGGFLGRRVKRTQFPMPTNAKFPQKISSHGSGSS
ncbi:hypothetical protein BDL97_11G024600 [Sphagnum fallax]|nr:hypothetical protein BDL97_11G024600 [Sphagnum fallax]